MTPCATCGGEVVVDFRAQRTFCGGCSRAPRFCTCAPAQARVRWLELARKREHGLARPLDQWRAA